MSPAAEALVKRLVVLASLVVLGSSIGFLLVACGGDSSKSLAQRRAGSTTATWHVLSAAPIRVDAGLTSVWTGKEMIVSGVRAGRDGTFIQSSDVEAAYDASTQTWRRLARPPKMDSYCRRNAVWIGKEMLVWGCAQVAFNPQTDRWRLLPAAPTGQGIVVWTGREMIGWGGGCCGDAWSGGSAYDPAANTWRTLAPSPLAPEQRPIGAWTGHELILLVSGIQALDGKPAPARLARAAAYDPATDTWRRIAPLPESGLPFGGTATWDGHEVLVVGAGTRSQDALAYDPATNRWRRLSSMPSGRFDVTAVWTGKRLLVWGARAEVAATSASTPRGFAYDPKSDRWSLLPQAPLRGVDQTMVWTGREAIVWGGVIGTPAGTNTPPKYLTDGAAFVPALERSAR